MCGRYASSRKPEDLVEEFEVDRVDVREKLEPDYNVAPTKPVYAVFDRVAHDAPRDSPPQRRLRTLTWGLVPSWAKDSSIGSRLINARMETLADKPAYTRAFAKRRCLLPADGYFEWYPTQQIGRSGKPVKQPFFIRPSDGGVLAMAGLYEIWRNREVPEDHDEAFLWTATIITTSAEDSLGHIHDRMPMLVERDRYSTWLDSSVVDLGDLSSLLVPASPGRLSAFPVSTAVNNVRNNGVELIEPLTPVGPPGALFEP
ncbi:MAG: SOS response-associated peptidase [Nocardioidaceae bacterium]